MSHTIQMKKSDKSATADHHSSRLWRRTVETGAIVGLTIGVLVLALGGVPVVTADEPDRLPASYYGTVTVDGDPAPAGTEVAAVVDGEVQDTLTVDTPGEYGGPGIDDEKLVVDAGPGAVVEFQVDGVPAEEAVEWEGGDVKEVALTVESSQEDESDDAGGSAASGGGGGEAGNGAGSSSEEDSAVTTTVEHHPDGVQASFDEGSPIDSITFEADTDTDETVRVVEHEQPPDETPQVPGAETTVVKVSVPSTLQDAAATVHVAVPPDRVNAVGAAPEELQVVHNVDDDWQLLETEVIEETDDTIIVEAETDGFSYFAVSAVIEPTATMIVPERVDTQEDVTLDGGDSVNQFGEIVEYEWRVDGDTLTGETTTISFTDPGEYDIELTVTNDAGKTATTVTTITVEGDDKSASDGDETADEDPEESDINTDDGLPGFGVIAAVLALLGVAARYGRRR